MNLHRRHLDDGQRSMVAAKVANMRQGERTDLSPIGEKISQEQAAAMLNVSKRNVERAAKVQAHGAPELVSAVERGERQDRSIELCVATFRFLHPFFSAKKVKYPLPGQKILHRRNGVKAA